MLTYLISSVQDLIGTALLFALVYAYIDISSDRTGRRLVAGGLALGVVLSVVMAVLKQTTKLIDTGAWNLWIFMLSALILLIALVFFIKPLATVTGTVGQRIREGALALFICARVFYKLPDVFLYPFNFNLTDNSMLSTDFLLRMILVLVGFVLVALLAFATYKCARTLSRRLAGIFALIPACIIAVVQVMTGVQTMLARRYIAQNHDLFTLCKFFANNADAFTIAIIVCALVPICIVLVKSFNIKEPYRNPAEHRKIRARWRNYRRWALCSLVCAVLCVVTLTVVADYNSRGPELSPSEECDVHDGNCYIPFEQVEDGHLHRFTWETENGVGIRFIIIKKPGSSAYGIGLDACDICGETGYYERDGQVVCKLCDVVMNINTIGFKGGCNPIPFKYSVEGGNIVIPTKNLQGYESTFKS